ncbi:unnamed protein product [Schistosoma rodhaini]|nr:unnamed protein product [Schistosoma rodhaini]
MIHHHNYQFIRIIIGCIGILTIISHIISAFLWISYILGWRINRKLKYIQQKQEINHHISIISNRNNINLRQQQQQRQQEGQQQEQQEQGQQPPLPQQQQQQQRQSAKLYKHNLTWPICTLRISTQIIIFSMIIINIIGFIDLIRLIYLSITGNDLRLLTNDWLCRIQIFISFISCDISEWHFVILCIERCYIILYPRKYYSINNTLIKPALIMIIIIYIICILANLFLFISNESICFIKFRNYSVNIIKFTITLIIPVLLITISTIIIIIVLIKWKLKNMKYRIKLLSYYNTTHNTTNDNNTTNNSNNNNSIKINKRIIQSFTYITSSIRNQLSFNHINQYNNNNNNNNNNKQLKINKLINYNNYNHHKKSIKIIVAKMMLLCAILYLLSLLSLFIFGLIYDDYCCFFIAKNNNNWNDNLFNLISILYWLIQSITSYILMLGAISIRNDIQIIIWYIWYNILKRNK